MVDWKKIIKKAVNFDRTAIIGLILLLTSFVMGALLRNSAYITDTSTRRFPTCDTYIRGFCIPTENFSIPLGAFGWLVINITSFLVSAILFILGVVLVRK
jgi:hypothetical protein